MDKQTFEKNLQQLFQTDFNSDISQFQKYIEQTLTKSTVQNSKSKTQVTPVDQKILISLSNINKEYTLGKHKVTALKDINLNIYAGEFVAIVGPSGSGKSTLLHLLGALDKPDSGQILIEGNDLAKFNDNQLSLFRNKMVGFIFQSFYLQPFLNVLQNTEIPLIFRKANPTIRKASASTAIESVGLGDRMEHLPKQLSGGQMQRVGIARAIVNEPKIVLADEPTANLDKQSTQEIIDLLRTINREKNITIVVVTHNETVASYADRIIKLDKGIIQ